MRRLLLGLLCAALFAGAMSGAGLGAKKEPGVTAEPASVDFGLLPFGEYTSQSVLFTNTTSYLLHVRPAVLTSPFSTYSRSQCNDLAPGDSCSIHYYASWLVASLVPGTYKAAVVQPFVWVDQRGAEHTVNAKVRFLVTLTADQRPTVNSPEPVSTPAETPVAITLTASDPDGDPLTFALASLESDVSNGSLAGWSGTPECSTTVPSVCSLELTYTPDSEFTGSDGFGFKVSDGQLDAESYVEITVTAPTQPNINPVVPNGLKFYTNMGSAQAFTLTGTDANIGDQLTFQITQQPTHGTFGAISTPSNCSGTPWTCTATVTYTPTAGYVGPDSFRFRAYDGQYYSGAIGAPAFITVSPAVVGDEPWADPISRSYNMNQTTTLTLTGGDPNGDPLTFEIVTGLTKPGTLTAPASVTCSSTTPSHCSATVSYTPPIGFYGTDSFTYRTFDGENYSVAQTYSLQAS